MRDGRRKQWYASSVSGGFSNTEQRLRDLWGCEGAYFWRLLLDAAAREMEPGTVTFRNDLELWTKLGVIATAFAPADFFAFTGKLRQTRKTYRNRMTIISITQWDEWQNAHRREKERDEKSSKRAEKAPDKTRTVSPTTTGTSTVDKPTDQRQGANGGVVDFTIKKLISSLPELDKKAETEIVSLATSLPEAVSAGLCERLSLGGVLNPIGYVRAELRREVAARSAA